LWHRRDEKVYEPSQPFPSDDGENLSSDDEPSQKSQASPVSFLSSSDDEPSQKSQASPIHKSQKFLSSSDDEPPQKSQKFLSSEDEGEEPLKFIEPANVDKVEFTSLLPQLHGEEYVMEKKLMDKGVTARVLYLYRKKLDGELVGDARLHGNVRRDWLNDDWRKRARKELNDEYGEKLTDEIIAWCMKTHRLVWNYKVDR
jgi:hypothetical protein